MFDGGVEKPHGAENSALKNTAPFSLTPLKISENASIRSSGLPAKSAGCCAKQSAYTGRPSKSWRRSGMVVRPGALHNCSPKEQLNMNRVLTFLYGAASYAVFLATFLYAIGFIGNLAVPKSLDSSAAGPWSTALIIDLGLLSLFALQHSVM